MPRPDDVQSALSPHLERGAMRPRHTHLELFSAVSPFLSGARLRIADSIFPAAIMRSRLTVWGRTEASPSRRCEVCPSIAGDLLTGPELNCEKEQHDRRRGRP